MRFLLLAIYLRFCHKLTFILGVAITSGDHITVSGMACDGSHGLSIGSVGGKSNNNVTNVVFEDSVVLNSQNGARIKTNAETTGFIAKYI